MKKDKAKVLYPKLLKEMSRFVSKHFPAWYRLQHKRSEEWTTLEKLTEEKAVAIASDERTSKVRIDTSEGFTIILEADTK